MGNSSSIDLTRDCWEIVFNYVSLFGPKNMVRLSRVCKTAYKAFKQPNVQIKFEDLSKDYQGIRYGVIPKALYWDLCEEIVRLCSTIGFNKIEQWPRGCHVFSWNSFKLSLAKPGKMHNDDYYAIAMKLVKDPNLLVNINSSMITNEQLIEIELAHCLLFGVTHNVKNTMISRIDYLTNLMGPMFIGVVLGAGLMFAMGNVNKK